MSTLQKQKKNYTPTTGTNIASMRAEFLGKNIFEVVSSKWTESKYTYTRLESALSCVSMIQQRNGYHPK